MIESRPVPFVATSSSSVQEPAVSGYLPALTGLRGIAASWVLLYHLWQFSGSPDLIVRIGAFSLALTPLASCGYMGVDLFFVLSGFLLSMPFHRIGEPPDLVRYGIQRCRRVLPAYYAQMIVLVAVFAWYGQTESLTVANLATHVLLVQNVWPAGPALNGVYWTMPIEWDFYIVLPAIALLLTRVRPPVMLVVLFGLSLAIRFACYLAYTDSAFGQFLSFGQIMQLPARLDEFFYGVIGARIYLRIPISRWRARWLIASGIVGVALTVAAYVYAGPLIYPAAFPALLFYFSVLGAAFGAIVLAAAAQGARKTIFSNVAVAWLGLISYSLYLWHYPMLVAAQHSGWTATGSAASMLRNLAVLAPPILIVAAISQHFVERPFLKPRSARGRRHGMPASLD